MRRPECILYILYATMKKFQQWDVGLIKGAVVFMLFRV